MATSTFLQVNQGTGAKVHTVTEVIGADTVHQEVWKQGEPYLASYTVTFDGISTATANSHLLQIMAGSSLKVRVRRIEMHQDEVATTAVLMNTRLYRLIAAGTGGSTTIPNPLETSDAAAGATVMILPTVKGTEGALIAIAKPYMTQTLGASSPLKQPIIVWNFDRPRSKPLIIAAGTSNGIAVKNLTAVAGAQVLFDVWLDESNF